MFTFNGKQKYWSFVVFIFCLFTLFQSNAQVIVDKNKGDNNQTRKGFMDGNLVGTVYYNFGEIADWQNEPSRSGVWPKGTNHTYVDGVAIIVQAEAQDPSGNLIHPLESNYYEFTRFDRATGITYGWWPLPGYAAPYSSSPARSDDHLTWPATWPDRLSDWDGYWNGFFGKGVLNADLETYFVFDDHLDREYLLNNNFTPDTEDPDRGGLAMQVKARGFQWSQVLAEDVIFWYYEITNMGNYDYEKTLFAQYVDWGIGGHDNSSNNAGDYNILLDLSYAWSTVPFGSPGNWSPVGLAGYAFLESPGIPDDREDNDRDGLTDERRDNEASVFIDSPESDLFLLNPAIDTVKFREFYTYSWQPHWDADENANWRSFGDIDENGVWDTDEPLNDDVGSDGIGPFDDGYPGPDFDGTEGNGKPDQGEPNFGILDKDESDQLGLTGFSIYPVHQYELDNDEENWQVLSGLPEPHGQSLQGVNLANYFSSYLFSMNGRDTYSLATGSTEEAGETERFSMSLIFGINENDIFRRKKTVQQIYNANYRFAKPPEKPMLTAIPGDERVILYWDDRAEKSFDAFYQRVNFEGYRIYRSTEPNFIENKLITDGFGKPIFREPLVQYDLIDDVTGFHPIDVNGALFYLGDDSGLKHSFIDTTVQNGQTYYYAISAYDQGFTTTTIEGDFEGIPPSETTTIIKQDINGKMTKDINTAVVIPRAPAAGYLAPGIHSFEGTGPGSGTISISILNPDSVKNNIYRLGFYESTRYSNDPHPGYKLINISTSDTLIKNEKILSTSVQTPVVDGVVIDIQTDTTVSVNYDKSKWTKGNSNYIVQIGFDSRFRAAYNGKRIDYPADFEIEITDPGEGTLSIPKDGFSQPIQSNIIVRNLTEGIDDFQFIFRDENKDELFNDSDAVFLVVGDSLGKKASSFLDAKISWSMTIIKDTTIAEGSQRHPQIGDVYKIVTNKPFRNNEFFEFTTTAQGFDRTDAISDLDDISVVPNPYVGAASWEPFSTSVGRGERRIYFMHLPNECTIRIYTISGRLVDTIEHQGTYSDGQEAWDLISKDGMDIAYGVYVYHVDAPGIGEKIGRFAIIK
ncbi:MAG: hypothetical protein K9J16_05500 [Melioribacteraceae bacterium]|nr:hypothetical protein [Melioribacteraceae bacterium]MCF8353254.1 hypothetical protein [Melioribacteraceae bacterium]MCF8395568.1 hypothetical protein [Melioribacteraceae bacterium]MCF8418781.1 hypothetical protein [Melioribacteraceae bacterium]